MTFQEIISQPTASASWQIKPEKRKVIFHFSSVVSVYTDTVIERVPKMLYTVEKED